MNSSVSLPPYHTIHFLTIIVPICPALQSIRQTYVFSLETRTKCPELECGSPCPTQSIMVLGRTTLSPQSLGSSTVNLAVGLLEIFLSCLVFY